MTLTEEQLKERATYIGASDAAAVLGLSRYKTPIEVWGEKTGIVPAEDISEKLPVICGNALEQLVADLFTKKTGKVVHRVNQTIYHPKFPFIACNLDRRVVGEDALLEAKTANQFKLKEWQDEAEIPKEYIVQVLHQLAVTGKAYGYLACLIGNTDFVWKRIDRDEALIEEIIAKEVAFWKGFVEPKVMPTKVTARDGDVLAKVFPESEPETTVSLTDEANRLCESLEALALDAKAIESVIEQEKNLLKVLLKENSVGVTDKYRVTWKTQSSTRIDSKKLKAEQPSVFDQYAKVSESRVLRTAPIKKSNP